VKSRIYINLRINTKAVDVLGDREFFLVVFCVFFYLERKGDEEENRIMR